MSKKCDISGQKFNSLIALELSNTVGGNATWKCLCDCGNITYVKSFNLKNGHTKSCGCLKSKTSYTNSITHGLSRIEGKTTRLHRVWDHIKSRCINNNDKHYSDYGGRGIEICEEWKNNYASFYNWAMSNGYKESLTIDRIDNNKGYSPDNCRFTTMKIQNRNKRNNVFVLYRGEMVTIGELSEISGINYKTLYKRIKSSWDVDKAMRLPSTKREQIERVD